MSGQYPEYTDDWVLRNLKNFIVDHAAEPIYEMMLDVDEGLFYGIPVNFLNLVQENMILGSMLISYPKRMLRLFDSAILDFQADVLQHHPLATQMEKKEKVHVRISNLPLNAETTKGVLPKSSDIGSLLAVRGTVIRTGLAKMLEWKKAYQCTRCKFEWEQEADIESVNPFPIPTQCLNPITPPCNNHKFLILEGGKVECKDYQEIKIQEQVHQLGVGAIPRSINVILMDDLVDFCKAGDDVTIAGIVSRRWRPMAEDERCDLEMILLANHIRVNNEQKASNINEDLRREFEEFWKKNRHAPLRARDMIISALCPELAGLHVAKTAVALALAGGVPRVDARGTTLRGEAHVLLVGDAGTGKSQLLRTASKVATRSVLTTGAGTTSAGLTVTAVKDKGGEWVLEAGALVLADGGICCIDEFGTIQEHDKAAIHEAMEQQTISVAKAGLVCKLRSRCSIISAMNPKGKFDTDEMNVAMATPLLSRFDLVILLLDEQNKEWDSKVCDFILRGHKADVKPDLVHKPLWPLDKLQVYFSYIKAAFAPNMTEESQEVLQMYYRKQRATDQRNAARTTLRLLESMIRLAQAHAKLMFRTQVTLQDAVCAVLVVESSMQTSAMLGVNSALRSYPAEDPDTLYLDQEVLVLKHLGLHHLIRDHTPIDIDNDDGPHPRDYDIRADYPPAEERDLGGLTGQSAVSEDLFDSQYSKWDQLRKKGPDNNNNNGAGAMQIKEELPSDFSGSLIPSTFPSDPNNHHNGGSTLLRKRKLEDTDPINPDTRPAKRVRSPSSGENENPTNNENNNDAAVDDWAADASLDWGLGDLNQPKNNADWDQQFV